MKTAVTKADWYEPLISEFFLVGMTEALKEERIFPLKALRHQISRAGMAA